MADFNIMSNSMVLMNLEIQKEKCAIFFPSGKMEEKLEQIIECNKEENILVVGDFNERTGKERRAIITDDNSHRNSRYNVENIKEKNFKIVIN